MSVKSINQRLNDWLDNNSPQYDKEDVATYRQRYFKVTDDEYQAKAENKKKKECDECGNCKCDGKSSSCSGCSGSCKP